MSERTWPRWLPNGFSLAVIVLLAANYFSTFGDLDYTWQVRTGELIVRTGDWQPADHFSYTMYGQPMPDFEWLYEVVLWLFWDNFGYGGLKLLKVVLVSSTLLLVVWRLRVAGIRWHGIALALTVAVACLAPAWNLRPLYCTTLGLLLVSGWLHDHCTGRRPLPWLLVPVMLLWGNTHPAVITGQALLLGAIVWEWVNRRLQINKPLDTAALKRLTLVGGLAFLATFLSPEPLARLRYPFHPNLAHPIQRVFVEMQPLYATVDKAPYTSGLIYVVAALVLVSVVLRFRQYRGWEVMMLGALTLLANTAARAAQDWLLVMLALGMPHLVVLFRQAVQTDRRRVWVRGLLRVDSTWRRAWDSPLLRVQRGWPLAAVALLVAVSLYAPLSRQVPRQDDDSWPAAALTCAQEKGLHGNFFGPPDYGAYVTWRLGDQARCYADTRGFFLTPELLEDSHYLPQLGPEWRSRLDRVLNEYKTDYFVLETTGPRGQLWRCLQPHVQGEVIYLDEQTVVLSATVVRQGVARMDLARK
jgi:hypothetical protein